MWPLTLWVAYRAAGHDVDLDAAAGLRNGLHFDRLALAELDALAVEDAVEGAELVGDAGQQQPRLFDAAPAGISALPVM